MTTKLYIDDRQAKEKKEVSWAEAVPFLAPTDWSKINWDNKAKDARVRVNSASAVFGEGYMNRLEAWDYFVKNISKFKDNKNIRRGKFFEPTIIAYGAEETESEVLLANNNIIFDNPDLRLRGKPDCFIKRGDDIILVEVKSTTLPVNSLDDCSTSWQTQLLLYSLLTGVYKSEFWIMAQNDFVRVPMLDGDNAEEVNETMLGVCEQLAVFLDDERPKASQDDEILYDNDLNKRMRALVDKTIQTDMTAELLESIAKHKKLSEEKARYAKFATQTGREIEAVKHDINLLMGEANFATDGENKIEIVTTHKRGHQVNPSTQVKFKIDVSEKELDNIKELDFNDETLGDVL